MRFNSFLHHQCYGWQPNKIAKIILIPGAYCPIMGRHFQDFSPFNNVEGYLLSPPIQCRNIKFWVEGWLCNVVQQSQWGRWWWNPFWEVEAGWECRKCQSKCVKKRNWNPERVWSKLSAEVTVTWSKKRTDQGLAVNFWQSDLGQQADCLKP